MAYHIAEFITAAILMTCPFWGPWAYYVATGNYLNF